MGIYLIRHGATELNNEDKDKDRIRGWIDVPLNNEGIKEAHRAALALKELKIQKIYSSDLIRALKTARIANQYHSKPLVISKALRPWHLGAYQLRITNEVLKRLKRFVRNESAVPEGGESFKSFRLRYLRALKAIMDEGSKKEIAVFSHFRNLKLAHAWAKKGMPDNLDVHIPDVLTDTFSTGNIYKLEST